MQCCTRASDDSTALVCKVCKVSCIHSSSSLSMSAHMSVCKHTINCTTSSPCFSSASLSDVQRSASFSSSSSHTYSVHPSHHVREPSTFSATPDSVIRTWRLLGADAFRQQEAAHIMTTRSAACAIMTRRKQTGVDRALPKGRHVRSS